MRAVCWMGLLICGCGAGGTEIDVERVLVTWTADGEAQAFIEQDGERLWARWDVDTFVPIGTAPDSASEATLVYAASRDEVYAADERERVLRVSSAGTWEAAAELPNDGYELHAMCGHTDEGLFLLGLAVSEETFPGSSFPSTVYRTRIYRAGETLEIVAPPLESTGAFNHDCFVSGGSLFVLMDGRVFRKDGQLWANDTPSGDEVGPRPWEAEVVLVAGEQRLYLQGALWRWADGWHADLVPLPSEDLSGTTAVLSTQGSAIDDLFMVNDVYSAGTCFVSLCGGGSLSHVEVRHWDGALWEQRPRLGTIERDGERFGVTAAFTDATGTYAIVGHRTAYGPL
jgi:hypothetical protein